MIWRDPKLPDFVYRRVCINKARQEEGVTNRRKEISHNLPPQPNKGKAIYLNLVTEGGRPNPTPIETLTLANQIKSLLRTKTVPNPSNPKTVPQTHHTPFLSLSLSPYTPLLLSLCFYTHKTNILYLSLSSSFCYPFPLQFLSNHHNESFKRKFP